MSEEVLIPLFSLNLRDGKIDIMKDDGTFDGNIVYCVKKSIEAASEELTLYKDELKKINDSGKMIGNIEKIETEKLYVMLLYIDQLLHQGNLLNYDTWNNVYLELEEVFKKRKKLN